ncbi:MAG: (2Fe-2S)-binding protein [Mycobacteriales bacterium]
MVLRVNGRDYEVDVEPRVTLVDVLRDVLGLTGTKKGCDRGECGACTVHVDGRRINACSTLAVMQAGHDIITIEGLGGPEGRHPMQRAFVARDGLQCGYGTPGQIMSAASCVTEGHTRSDAEIREWMSGNLCRCAAYSQIIDAIRQVAGTIHA